MALNWERLTKAAPEVLEASSNRYTLESNLNQPTIAGRALAATLLFAKSDRKTGLGERQFAHTRACRREYRIGQRRDNQRRG